MLSEHILVATPQENLLSKFTHKLKIFNIKTVMIFPINVTLVNASVTDLIGIMITNSSKVHNCQDTQYIQTTSLGMMWGMATFLTEASESVFRSAALCWDGHPFPSLPICLSSHSSLCMIPTFQKCYRLELHNFFLTATIIPLVTGYKDIKIISLSIL